LELESLSWLLSYEHAIFSYVRDAISSQGLSKRSGLIVSSTDSNNLLYFGNGELFAQFTGGMRGGNEKGGFLISGSIVKIIDYLGGSTSFAFSPRPGRNLFYFEIPQAGSGEFMKLWCNGNFVGQRIQSSAPSVNVLFMLSSVSKDATTVHSYLHEFLMWNNRNLDELERQSAESSLISKWQIE